MARVDVHFVGGGVALEQGLLAFGQMALVLAHVLRGDHQDGLLVGVGIDRLTAGKLHMVPARHFAKVLAGVGRNGALRITGFLGTDTGQFLAEFGSLFRRHLRKCVALQADIGGHCSYEHHAFCCYFHRLTPSQTRTTGVPPLFLICGEYIVRKD